MNSQEVSPEGEGLVDAETVGTQIECYVYAYYSELRDQMAQYSRADEIFPSHLRGRKRVTAVLCSDGAFASHWPAEEDSFNLETQQIPVSEAMRQATDGALTYRYGARGPADMAILQLITQVADGPEQGTVISRSPWHMLELASTRDADRWDEARAKRNAADIVSTFLAAHLMRMQEAPPPDILGKLTAVIQQFEDLLEQAPREEDLQAFLRNNPVILSPDAADVIPKHPLGSEYITDFVVHGSGDDYVLVEIEQASHPLFTMQGNPTFQLSHALQQVEDWRGWVLNNVSYARNDLPGITDPRCLVVIGRDADLEENQRSKLDQKNRELTHITIMTCDDLLKRARGHLDNLKRMR